MDKVKDYLAIACLAYDTGDADFAVRSFLKGMDEARANGEQGLQKVVEFLRAPVAQLVTNVPAAENTMAPSLHSDTTNTESTPDESTEISVVPLGVNPEEGGVNEIGIVPAVDPSPAPITDPVPSTTIAALCSSMIDEGDEELEARAEAEDEIDDDSEEDEDDEESEEEEEEDEDEGGMKLSISSSTPLRLRQG